LESSEVASAVDSLACDAPKAWLKRNLPYQNGLVVACNPVMKGICPGNQAAYILGSTAASRVASMYLVKYLTKDSHKLAATASAFALAMRETKRKPSVAEDAGTPRREAMHVLERTINSLSVTQELSGTQAAAIVLGHPAEMSSHKFASVYVDAATQFCAKWQMATISSEVDDDAVTDDDSVSGEAGEGQVESGGGDGDIEEAADDDLCASFGSSTAQIYTGANGEKVVIPQHIHYMYRSDALAALTLYEYVSYCWATNAKFRGGARHRCNQTSKEYAHPLFTRTPSVRDSRTNASDEDSNSTIRLFVASFWLQVGNGRRPCARSSKEKETEGRFGDSHNIPPLELS
jgi:hypothetical protein